MRILSARSAVLADLATWGSAHDWVTTSVSCPFFCKVFQIPFDLNTNHWSTRLKHVQCDTTWFWKNLALQLKQTKKCLPVVFGLPHKRLLFERMTSLSQLQCEAVQPGMLPKQFHRSVFHVKLPDSAPSHVVFTVSITRENRRNWKKSKRNMQNQKWFFIGHEPLALAT